MPRPIIALTLIAFGACTAFGAARADVSFTIAQGGGAPSTYQVRDQIVRSTMTGPQGQELVLLYDSRQETVTNILPAQRSYSVVDRDGIRRQQQQVQNQMRQMLPQMEQQMREQLRGMPAEQRRLVEERMNTLRRSLAGEAEPASLQARMTERHDTIAGIRCSIYEVVDAGEVVGSACIADAQQLAISEQDFSALLDMFAFMQDMNSGLAAKLPPQFPGVPLRVTDAQGRVASELQSVDRGDLAADLFRPPAGYRRTEPFQRPSSGG